MSGILLCPEHTGMAFISMCCRHQGREQSGSASTVSHQLVHQLHAHGHHTPASSPVVGAAQGWLAIAWCHMSWASLLHGPTCCNSLLLHRPAIALPCPLQFPATASPCPLYFPAHCISQPTAFPSLLHFPAYSSNLVSASCLQTKLFPTAVGHLCLPAIHAAATQGTPLAADGSWLAKRCLSRAPSPPALQNNAALCLQPEAPCCSWPPRSALSVLQVGVRGPRWRGPLQSKSSC